MKNFALALFILPLLLHSSSTLAQEARNKDALFKEALAAEGLRAIPIMRTNAETGLVTKGYEFTFKDGSFPKNGPGIVLQHGWFSNPASMIHFIRPYLELGYRPHAFSWRGHGWGPEVEELGVGNRSFLKNPKRGDYSPLNMIEDAEQISDLMTERTGTFFSVGHSMGAMVTSAANAMGRFFAKAMVLVGGPPHFNEMPLIQKLFVVGQRPIIYDSRFPKTLGSIPQDNSDMSRLSFAIQREMVRASPLALGSSVVYTDSVIFFNDIMTGDHTWEGLEFRSPALIVKGSKEPIKGIIRDAPVRGKKAGHETMVVDGKGHLGEIDFESVRAMTPEAHRFYQEFNRERDNGKHFDVESKNPWFGPRKNPNPRMKRSKTSAQFLKESCFKTFSI